jgi:hypothetical protein
MTKNNNLLFFFLSFLSLLYSSLIKKAEDLAFLEKEDGLASLEIIGREDVVRFTRRNYQKVMVKESNGKMIPIKKIIQPHKDATELAEEDSKILA